MYSPRLPVRFYGQDDRNSEMDCRPGNGRMIHDNYAQSFHSRVIKDVQLTSINAISNISRYLNMEYL